MMRALGVLGSSWHIIAHQARSILVKKMKFIVKKCIIVHNMMFEQRKKENGELEEFYSMSEEVTEGTKLVPSTSSM